MQQYNTYIVGGAEVDLNAPEFAGQKAVRLNQLLFDLRALLPEIVKMKEPALYGKYEYNFSRNGRCYDLKYDCGHEYHATDDNWFQPRCSICGAALEDAFKRTPGWSRREVQKKGLLGKLLAEKKE